MNNKTNYGKRTANQVNSILKANDIDAKSINLGNGIEFDIRIESNLRNRFALKKAGFILCRGKECDNFITVKCC